MNLRCPAGVFAGVQRVFAWNSPNTYYTELATPWFESPLNDLSESDNYRTDTPAKVRCRLRARQDSNSRI